MMRRVLLVTEYYPPFFRGGAERSAQYLARGLSAAGVPVTVITLNLKNFRFLHETDNGVEVIFVPLGLHVLSTRWLNIVLRSLPFYAVLFLILAVIAARRSPVTFHAQNKHVLIPAFLAARLLGAPFVSTIRDTMLICQSGICLADGGHVHPNRLLPTLRCLSELRYIYTGSRKLGPASTLLGAAVYLDTQLKRAVLRKSGCVIFVSDALRTLHAAHGIRPQSSVVIHNVAPRAEGETASPDRSVAKVRETGGVSYIVFTAGKLSFGKGTKFLLDAVPLVAHVMPGVLFVFAGRLELPFKVPEGCEKHVRFLGNIPEQEVFAWYSTADVVTQVSVWPEPLSRSLLEAMVFGRPVIATRVGGNGELVADGETGFLVGPRDPEALADAILKLLGNRALRERMGKGGLHRLRTQFSPEAAVEMHRRQYALLEV
jgi:glycosyltransferase involved in cell wall biosynthesis